MKSQRLIVRVTLVLILMGSLFYMNNHDYPLWAIVLIDVLLLGLAVEMLVRVLAVEKYQLADREEDQ
ncbi:multidrug ABC transporter permease [Fructobacillus pseudoficulneus]|uniref:Multidrug ABC transporter permease n=1 Tax=Fructobacillus pseudoficulneus TaxID=220714 RepID=A0A3F3GVP9_9LACO|nr:hypothetical protein [Fructobacillus pseudoficulneus]GAP02392.1 multidrug ABC transporter permease [Fructobacillus pseudoficulneus]SEH36650.1 hypothetical protein SAMN05660469_0344 [Fructobacillus pseudoficulneus]